MKTVKTIRMSDPIIYRGRCLRIGLVKIADRGQIWVCTDGGRGHFAPTALRALIGWHEMHSRSAA